MSKAQSRFKRPEAPSTRTRGELKLELRALKKELNQRIWAARLAGPSAVETVYAEYEPRIATLTAQINEKSNKNKASPSLARGVTTENTQLSNVSANVSANVSGNVAHAEHTRASSKAETPILDAVGTPLAKMLDGRGGQSQPGGPFTDSGGEESKLNFQKSHASTTRKSRIITLPHNWEPRHYQVPVFEALDSGIKRAITVWHRRAGKDHCAMNYTAKAMHQRVGIYWHVLPTQRQARKAVWEGMSRDGYRFIDQAFPKELRKRTRDDDMMIEFHNGSIWRCVGGDNFDGLVGSNPIGVVFSEYAIMDPRGWRFTSPILAENDGWAWFISTPRGKNHFFHLYDDNKGNPAWYCEIQGIDKTGAVPLWKVEEERLAGMPENLIQQEYYCSFEQANAGSVYGNELEKVRKLERIRSVPYDARYPVETYWDIGVRDATAVIFAQRINGEVRVIDYYSKSNEGFPHFAKVLREKPYSYSRHIGPHDLGNRLFISGQSTTQMIAEQFGIHFTIAPKVSLSDGIESGRAMLSRSTFDKEKCADLLLALGYYHRKWDEEKQVFDPTPVHDWSSHPCSAWMYGSLISDEYGTMPAWAKSPEGLTTGLSIPAGIPIPGVAQQPSWAKPAMGGFSAGYPLGAGAQQYDPLAGWR